jgi:hypothetical protein
MAVAFFAFDLCPCGNLSPVPVLNLVSRPADGDFRDSAL